MNAATAKIALLSYCRFARQMHYVATEVSVPGNALADVLASNGSNLIEYEVKISMSDLRGDKKKFKHFIYSSEPITWNENIGTKGDTSFEIRKEVNGWGENELYAYIGEDRLTYCGFKTLDEAKEYIEKQYGAKAGAPNMLYYVIPHHMWENSQEKVVAAIDEKYGVITFTGHNYHGLIVQRKAKKLHKEKVNEKTLSTIVSSMSSELATITMAYYRELEVRIDCIAELGKSIEKQFKLDDGLDDK
jgi:hypothetical protein